MATRPLKTGAVKRKAAHINASMKNSDAGKKISENLGKKISENLSKKQKMNMSSNGHRQKHSLANNSKDDINSSHKLPIVDDNENDENNSRKDRKTLRKERRALKPFANVAEDVNVVWNVRISTLEGEQKEKTIQRLIERLKIERVNIATISQKHDVSRVVQQLFKHGNKKQREQLVELYIGEIKNLIYDKYAHHILLKMLRVANTALLKRVQAELRGQLFKLSQQKQSATVIDYIFAASHGKQRALFLQEFYSPEFALFEQHVNGSLSDILTAQPQKRDSIANYMKKNLIKSYSKDMATLRFVQMLTLEFVTNLPEYVDNDLLELLRKNASELWASQSGAEVLIWLISLSSAKERKALVKIFKPLVLAMAESPSGCFVLLQCFYAIDDTVLTGKELIRELVPSMQRLLASDHAVKLLLLMVVWRDQRYLPPAELALLPKKLILNGTELDVSKKDPKQKHMELLGYILPSLLNTLKFEFETVLNRTHGHSLILEALIQSQRSEVFGMKSEALLKQQDIREASSSLLQFIADMFYVSGDKNSLAEHFKGHRLVKSLLQLLPEAYHFATIIYKNIQDTVVDIAESNRGAFVLLALINVLDSDKQAVLRSTLNHNISRLHSSSVRQSTPTQGISLLLRWLGGEQSVLSNIVYREDAHFKDAS